MIRGEEDGRGASGRVSSGVVHCSTMKLAIYVFTIDGLCATISGTIALGLFRLTEVCLSAYQLMLFYFRLVDRKRMYFRAGSDVQ